ncbi:UNVERIFIED_ORG: hypothetical protein GGE53_000158 [Rhizobium etli]
MNDLPACDLAARRFRRGRNIAQTTIAVMIQKPIRQRSRNCSKTAKSMLRRAISIRIGRSKEGYEDRCENERHDPEADALSDHSKRKSFGRSRKIFPDTLAKPQGNNDGEAEKHQGQAGEAARHQPGADESNRHQCAQTKDKAGERGRFHKGRRR